MMLNKKIFVLLAFIGCFELASAGPLKPTGAESYRPASGYVPTAQVAEEIAYAVLVPVYGKEVIDPQKPFKVWLIGGRWQVEGRLPSDAMGGTFELEISKRDGTILRMAHSK